MMFHKLYFVVTHNVSVLLCSDIRSIFKNCKELHWYKSTKTNFKCILVQTLTVSAQENVFVSCLLFIFRADLSAYPYPVLGYMQRNSLHLVLTLSCKFLKKGPKVLYTHLLFPEEHNIFLRSLLM